MVILRFLQSCYSDVGLQYFAGHVSYVFHGHCCLFKSFFVKWDCTNKLISIQVMENVSCSMDKCRRLVRETIGFLDPHGLHSHVEKKKFKKKLSKCQKSGICWPNILISRHSLIPLSLTDPSAAP